MYNSFERLLKAHICRMSDSVVEQKKYLPPPGAVVAFTWFRRRLHNCRLTYLLTY